ncbi:MAG: hypothetical protein A2W76_08475 [Gammaproteobacteria bacterium RIFCSPLOWO2_12_47_11]|nr:MAG: hypothetical protein A2W76_08475 [Gammaproteobacteria bacterium RIFCSPLOWO2_12_47_11]
MEYDDVVKEFIDFVNLQVGVYMNSIAGFSGAKIQMERQVARVLRAQSRKKDAKGDLVITHQSFEDPQSPDVVHSRIITAEKFIEENSPSGINQRQLSYSVIVFIYTYWEDEIRLRLATAAGIDAKNVTSDIMSDLRCIRNSILHTKGVFTPEWHVKLVVLKDCFAVDEQIEISYELMHQIFVKIKQGCAKLIFEWLGVEPEGRFDIDQLKGFAIQKGRVKGPE